MLLRKVFILPLLVLPIIAAGQGRNIGTFRLSDRNQNQAAILIVKTKPFVRSSHRIKFASPEYLKKHEIHVNPNSDVSMVQAIDGRTDWLGTDGEIPSVEITSMTVSFGGKKIIVPRSLYSDCFN